MPSLPKGTSIAQRDGVEARAELRGGDILDYYTIEGHCTAEEIIKKSQFIVNCFHVENEGKVEEILKSIQKEHYKATHNCYAYVLGREKETQKHNDDGEPSGTAGKPILESILHNGLTNILIIVTRYFGGIKLGAGGLVRAYSGTATLGINQSTHVKMQYSSLMEISCEYTNLGKIKDYLAKNQIKEEEAIYDDKVRIHAYIPISDEEKIQQDLVELTNDQVGVCKMREEYVKQIISKN